jgi:hypothetical protein
MMGRDLTNTTRKTRRREPGRPAAAPFLASPLKIRPARRCGNFRYRSLIGLPYVRIIHHPLHVLGLKGNQHSDEIRHRHLRRSAVG